MFNGALNNFCYKANKIATEKGFWDSTTSAMSDSISAGGFVQDILDAFISQKIALIMSECGEALEAMRKNHYGLEEKDTFEDELADVFIRLADLCGQCDIDIERQIEWKMELNKTRGAKHGKNF